MSEFPNESVRLAASSLMSHPLHFPDEFKDWMADMIAVNIPMIPFGHVFGSRINIARSGDYIVTSEACSTTATYSDLATVGPQIVNLSNGKYMIFYGCLTRGKMAPSINGAAPSDDDCIDANETIAPMSRAIVRSLTNNNVNTIKMQYKETQNFSHRWLVVVRIGAPGE